MNGHSGNATYGYNGANDGHNNVGDSGDDGVNDTTDGRNDGTLRERSQLVSTQKSQHILVKCIHHSYDSDAGRGRGISRRGGVVLSAW